MEFRTVSTLDEALAELDERGGDTAVLAGGTDFTIQYLRGELRPASVLHIERVEQLKSVTNGSGLRLGALVTHRQLSTDAQVVRHASAVAEAAATVGGWQTMAVGTVGGNVCNASPAADVVPALLVHEAEAVLASKQGGERRVPLDRFILGRRRVDRRPTELLASLALAAPPPRTGDAYVKVGRRGAMEIAIVGLAARLTFDESGVVRDARLAVGSMASTAVRLPTAESALVGTSLDSGALDEAGRLLLEAVNPIDDVRGSAAYRRAVAPRVLARAAELCRQRALAGA
ncbi:MAG: FAD binding domain-containing protein [Actinomycetota bacterium]